MKHQGKFDSRIDEGIFLGYATTSKAYKCYNLRLQKMVESLDVRMEKVITHKRTKDGDDQPTFEPLT